MNNRIRLEEWEEVVGLLEDVDNNELIIDHRHLKIPENQTRLIAKAMALKGKRIGILRTDYAKLPYLIREADE
ncbi:MAG: hypothetical protein NTY03_08700 [Candidatus Bathyarchaeota archaeon]|nr:hypothetical protein [Candidatus Bathyarchaeota archaeon]